MIARRLGLLCCIVSATAGCRADAEPGLQGSPAGGNGSGGTTAGAGDGGTANVGSGGTAGSGSGGAAGGGSGGGGAADAGNDGDSDAGDDGASDAGADGASPAVLDFGDLGGNAFEVRSSNATFTELPGDRAYVSISINGWGETCDMALVCGEEQLNFTLYAIGGTRDNLQPGSYAVGSTTAGDVTYEVVGAAGRYDGACTTNGGFDSLASGTLTLTASGADRVQGEVNFTLNGGNTLSGAFDAIDCTQ